MSILRAGGQLLSGFKPAQRCASVQSSDCRFRLRHIIRYSPALDSNESSREQNDRRRNCQLATASTPLMELSIRTTPSSFTRPTVYFHRRLRSTQSTTLLAACRFRPCLCRSLPQQGKAAENVSLHKQQRRRFWISDMEKGEEAAEEEEEEEESTSYESDDDAFLSLSEKPGRNMALLDDYEMEELEYGPSDANHRSG